MTVNDDRGAGSGRFSRVRRLLMRHPLMAVSVPAFLGLAALPLGSASEFMDAYVRVGRLLVDGQDLYRGETHFLYPPFAALVGIAFVSLPEHLARLLWRLVNAAAMVWLPTVVSIIPLAVFWPRSVVVKVTEGSVAFVSALINCTVPK